MAASADEAPLGRGGLREVCDLSRRCGETMTAVSLFSASTPLAE